MRVIAGSARRLVLKTAGGEKTRPTTDRIKETLFNILQPELPGCRFLDLFAGSGGIGIEALSRGADMAVFVEKDRTAARCIRENLRTTRLEDRAQLLVTDVFRALEDLPGPYPYDFIFMDPPYNQGIEKKVLEALRDHPAAGADTRIIVEASYETDFSYLPELGYGTIRRKEYKTNVHMFIKRAAVYG